MEAVAVLGALELVRAILFLPELLIQLLSVAEVPEVPLRQLVYQVLTQYLVMPLLQSHPLEAVVEVQKVLQL